MYFNSGEMPIYSELVLSLYYKENKELTGGGNKKLTGGIHRYWYCNILDGRVMVTLKNNDPVEEGYALKILYKQISRQ